MSTKKDRALLDARMKKYEESGVAQLDDAYEEMYLKHFQIKDIAKRFQFLSDKTLSISSDIEACG